MFAACHIHIIWWRGNFVVLPIFHVGCRMIWSILLRCSGPMGNTLNADVSCPCDQVTADKLARISLNANLVKNRNLPKLKGGVNERHRANVRQIRSITHLVFTGAAPGATVAKVNSTVAKPTKEGKPDYVSKPNNCVRRFRIESMKKPSTIKNLSTPAFVRGRY